MSVHFCSYSTCELAKHPVPINNTDGVHCYLCDNLFHLDCAVACGFEVKKPNYLWVCDLCFKNKSRFKTYICATVELMKSEIKSEIAVLQEKVESVLKLKTTYIPVPTTHNTTGDDSSHSGTGPDVLNTVNMLELKDRKYNIVLYGMDIDHEMLFNPYPRIEHLFEMLKVPTSEIRDVAVLRRNNLIKVTLYSMRYRSMLLAGSKQFRKRTDGLRKVYINPDLSYEERRRNRSLRDLRKATQEKNPGCEVFIKKNEVLLRSHDGLVSVSPDGTPYSQRTQSPPPRSNSNSEIRSREESMLTVRRKPKINPSQESASSSSSMSKPPSGSRPYLSPKPTSLRTGVPSLSKPSSLQLN